MLCVAEIQGYYLLNELFVVREERLFLASVTLSIPPTP